MCLITDQKVPHIAKCDIVVYKLLKPNGETIYQFFKYELGKKYKTSITVKNSTSCFDDEDSVTLRKTFGWHWDYKPKTKIYSYSTGFHAAFDPDRFDAHLYNKDSFFKQKKEVFECIIPKGSKYYTNPSGLVVSNQIIIIKSIKKNYK